MGLAEVREIRTQGRQWELGGGLRTPGTVESPDEPAPGGWSVGAWL